jgi:hypothetical protein
VVELLQENLYMVAYLTHTHKRKEEMIPIEKGEYRNLLIAWFSTLFKKKKSIGKPFVFTEQKLQINVSLLFSIV